jgi:uncharacterized protein (DUF3084 family)
MNEQETREHLAEAERHVAEGQQLLARQRELIQRLRTNLAAALTALEQCEHSQKMHIADRDRLKKALEQFPGI